MKHKAKISYSYLIFISFPVRTFVCSALTRRWWWMNGFPDSFFSYQFVKEAKLKTSKIFLFLLRGTRTYIQSELEAFSIIFTYILNSLCFYSSRDWMWFWIEERRRTYFHSRNFLFLPYLCFPLSGYRLFSTYSIFILRLLSTSRASRMCQKLEEKWKKLFWKTCPFDIDNDTYGILLYYYTDISRVFLFSSDARVDTFVLCSISEIVFVVIHLFLSCGSPILHPHKVVDGRPVV
jgi:hypothetical protein